MRIKHFLTLTMPVISMLVMTSSAEAIVNGTVATGPNWEAVVSLNGGQCTATFVHPRFAITAAHCIRRCDKTTDRGCIISSGNQLDRDNWRGRDGNYSAQANTGVKAGYNEGTPYNFDYIYFPIPTDMSRSTLPDVAILKSTSPFVGHIIPILPTQDLPRPDESNYCGRYEYTWPTVAGFSPNKGTATRERRFGRAFAECDLEIDETTFKYDGHGRSGQRGIRTCPGDSGGPVLWETGFGGLAVGGIHSAADSGCPSERGEMFGAFIPANFLNRVAQTDASCHFASSWDECVNGVIQYNGYTLRYLGTEIDQCGDNNLRIPGINGDITIARGGTGAVELGSNRFQWYCGGSREWTTAPYYSKFVVAKRGLTDRQIIWDSYEVLKRPYTDIINLSGKCLDIHAPDMYKNGAKVQVWKCVSGANNQRWQFKGKAIINAGGKCLEASDMRNNGARVQAWDCNGSPQQTWQKRGQLIVNAGGQCLEIESSKMNENGGRAMVWECDQAQQQLWR